jgi:hypothetical protein
MWPPESTPVTTPVVFDSSGSGPSSPISFVPFVLRTKSGTSLGRCCAASRLISTWPV